MTRLGPNQLKLSEVNRWAEPLDSNFEQVLGQDLSRQLGTQRIVKFLWYASTQVEYQVEVQVNRFDTGSDGPSQLNAGWIIKDGKTGRELFATETIASSGVTGDDSAGSGALSRDVSELSRHRRTHRTAEPRARGRAESKPAPQHSIDHPGVDISNPSA